MVKTYSRKSRQQADATPANTADVTPAGTTDVPPAGTVAAASTATADVAPARAVDVTSAGTAVTVPDQPKVKVEPADVTANPSSACPIVEPPPVIEVPSDDSFATAEESSDGDAEENPEVHPVENPSTSVTAPPVGILDEVPDSDGDEPPVADTAADPTGDPDGVPATGSAEPPAGTGEEPSIILATDKPVTDGHPLTETLAVEEAELPVELSDTPTESPKQVRARRPKKKSARSHSASDPADLSRPRKKQRSTSVREHGNSDSDAETFRSKKFSSSRAKERYDSFISRGTIAERLVDLKQEDEWGYIAVINTGHVQPTVSKLGSYVPAVVAEFYANLPDTLPEQLAKGVKVFVRGHEYEFSPKSINRFYGLQALSNAEVKAESDADSLGLEKLAKCLTEGNKKSWAGLSTTDLSPRFAALVTIAAYNWMPSTHKNHISVERARLIYKLSRGIRVDVGMMIFKQVMNLSLIQKKDSRWLIFPRTIYGLLDTQHPPRLLDGEQFVSPVLYKKDIRSGVTFVKKEEAAGPSKRTKKAPANVAPSAPAVSLSDSDPSSASQHVSQRPSQMSGRPASPDSTIATLDAILDALGTVMKSIKILRRTLTGGESDAASSESNSF